MKNFKRILSSALVFCMLLSLAPAAFAAEDATTPVVADGNSSVTVGNVTVTTNGDAVRANENATVNVEGEIIQYSADSPSEFNYITPVDVSTSEGDSAAVNVSGSVYGTAPAGEGVYSRAQESESTVNIGGSIDIDLEAPVTSELEGTGVYSLVHGESGSSSVTVDGDVNISGDAASATGVSAYISADYTEYDPITDTLVDIDNASTTATNSVSVGGDIAVGAAELVYGVSAGTEEGGTVTVTVDGGITAGPTSSESYSNATGVNVELEKDAGTVEVAVGGDILLPDEANVACGVSSDVHASYWEWNEETGTSEPVNVESTTGSGNVTVDGNITVFASDYAEGISSLAAEGGSSEITVGGGVYAEGTSETYSYATGVYVDAEDGAEAAVNVGDDVSLWAHDYAEGVNANARNDGSAEVDVDGNVLIEVYPDDAHYQSQGVSATVSGDGGSVSVNVEGDVTVSGIPGSATGVNVSSYGTYWEWDEETMSDNYIAVDSTDGVASVTVGGDVTVTAANDARGVVADSTEGATSEALIEGGVTVNVGSGLYNQAIGVDAVSNDEGTTTVNICDDINVSLSSENGVAFGAQIRAQDDGTTSVQIDGDLNINSLANATAVSVSSIDAAADVTVNGDISVDGDLAVGANALAQGGQIDMTLNGDVDVSGETRSTALNVTGFIGGSAMVVVNGSLSAESASDEPSSTGLSVNAYSQASVDVTVNGDISADNALYIHTATPSDMLPDHVNVTIDGTVSGRESSITFEGNADSVTITVWKVDLDEDGHAVTPIVRDAESEPEMTAEELDEMNAKSAAIAEQVERDILYIIKLEQPLEGGTLSLGGTTKSEGFDVAKEGDNVVLYIAVADGYQVDGAYNGDGAKVELQKDGDGNYFLVVPRGGGVCLSAVMSLIPVIEAIVPPEESVTKEPTVANNNKKAIAKTETTVAAGEASEAEEPIAVEVKDDQGSTVSATVKVVFYSDRSFEVVITGEDGAQTKIEGTFKFVDDVLTLVFKDGTEIAMNEDGVLILPLSNGRSLEIKLDQATIDALKKVAG